MYINNNTNKQFAEIILKESTPTMDNYIVILLRVPWGKRQPWPLVKIPVQDPPSCVLTWLSTTGVVILFIHFDFLVLRKL